MVLAVLVPGRLPVTNNCHSQTLQEQVAGTGPPAECCSWLSLLFQQLLSTLSKLLIKIDAAHKTLVGNVN
jgi:hypothetical protein